MNELLKTEGLTKKYDSKESNFTAVDNISFVLKKGETLGIVGESGCGKSTIAKMILRLTEPTDGKIYLNEKDITKAQGKELRDVYRRVQMVFQSPTRSFDPRKTVGYGIEESMRNLGVPKAERKRLTAEIMGKCGLPFEYAKRYPHQLSGGECQRAAIARALAVSPELLVCDEATSALDVTVQYQIMKLLESLKKENNLSFIFICHNLALVQSFCDRVLVMQDGKIVEEGSPDDIIKSPKAEYTKLLIDTAF